MISRSRSAPSGGVCAAELSNGSLISQKSDELRDANFDGHFRIRETESIEANAAALAQFLAATPEKAYEIANIDYLFAD